MKIISLSQNAEGIRAVLAPRIQWISLSLFLFLTIAFLIYFQKEIHRAWEYFLLRFQGNVFLMKGEFSDINILLPAGIVFFALLYHLVSKNFTRVHLFADAETLSVKEKLLGISMRRRAGTYLWREIANFGIQASTALGYFDLCCDAGGGSICLLRNLTSTNANQLLNALRPFQKDNSKSANS